MDQTLVAYGVDDFTKDTLRMVKIESGWSLVSASLLRRVKKRAKRKKKHEGLKQKYVILKINNDGELLYTDDTTETGKFQKYFVINPWKGDEYGKASRRAIEAYSKAIKKTNPVLSRDLDKWVKETRRK